MDDKTRLYAAHRYRSLCEFNCLLDYMVPQYGMTRIENALLLASSSKSANEWRDKFEELHDPRDDAIVLLAETYLENKRVLERENEQLRSVIKRLKEGGSDGRRA